MVHPCSCRLEGCGCVAAPQVVAYVLMLHCEDNSLAVHCMLGVLMCDRRACRQGSGKAVHALPTTEAP